MFKVKSLNFLLTFITILISIDFWSFTLISKEIYSFLEVCIITFLVCFYISKKHAIDKLHLPFWINIKFIIFIPIILGSIGALIFHNQDIDYSLWRQRTNTLWLLYPILHFFKIKSEKIIKMMLLVGVIWCFFNIIQQFTYPTYFFASRTEGSDSKEELLRAGVYRYMPFTWHYGMFMAFYFFDAYLIDKKLRSILLVILGLISFYYLGTRQFAFAFVFCLIIHSVRQKGNKLVFALLFIVLAAVVIYLNFNLIFGKFIEMTNNQVVDNDDYIRFKSFNFFFFDYWGSWTTILTGNGLPYIASNYGTEVEYIKNYYGYYASDLGIIGSLSNFGVFYTIAVFVLIFKISTAKIQFSKNNYLKLIGINAFILIFLNETFLDPHVIPFWCLILYLIDKASDKKIIANEKF